MKQLIPARGRKLIHPMVGSKKSRNNSSPQGDGNGLPAAAGLVRQETTHPRKGTETLGHWNPNYERIETTHPRKGTETLFAVIGLQVGVETTHPRKGTETCLVCGR